MKKIPINQYSGYQRQSRNEALDFDDLIMTTIRLFERVPDALEYYQNKFQYIHVENIKIPIKLTLVVK